MIFSKCALVQEPASEYWYTPPQTGSISATAASSVCRARLMRSGIAGLGAGDGKIHAVGVDVFLVLAPAAEFFIVGFVEILRQRRALLLAEKG